MSGFDREWRDKILGFNSHLQIARSHPPSTFTEWPTILSIITNLPQVRGAADDVALDERDLGPEASRRRNGLQTRNANAHDEIGRAHV